MASTQAHPHTSHFGNLHSPGSIQGPPNTCDLLPILERNIRGNGNQTEKYPLQVLFCLLGASTGDPIRNFSIGLSVGFATTIAAMLTALAAIHLRWMVRAQDTGVPACQCVARKLLAVLQLCCTYDPQPDTMAQATASIHEKMAASSRQRPTTLQLLCSLARRAKELLAGGSRKSLSAILGDLIKEYNKNEKVTQCKINLDEATSVKFLARRSSETLREIKLIWSNERVQFSAVPMNLLAANFLDEARELPVTDKDNPRWHAILKPTEAKYQAFFRRAGVRYAHRLADTVARGKAPNVRTQASLYRDSDPETAWRMTCLWVEAKPVVLNRCSQERARDLMH